MDRTSVALDCPGRIEPSAARSTGRGPCVLSGSTYENYDRLNGRRRRLSPTGNRSTSYGISFIPAERIPQRVARDRVPYDMWVRGRRVTATPGPAVDYETSLTLVKWSDEFDVKVIAYDPWNATDLVAWARKSRRVYLRQSPPGFRDAVGPGVESLETAIVSKKLRHDGHAVLRWNIAEICRLAA